MSRSKENLPETVEHAFRERSAPSLRSLRLLVIVDGVTTTYTCEPGVVVVGREADADVAVDSPKVSRRHLNIHIADDLRVEDLGSRNGTYLRGAPLTPGTLTVVEPGESVELGPNVTLVLQRLAARVPPRRLLPHGYFAARLEEACSAAGSSGATFCVLRVAAAAPCDAHQLEKILSHALEPHDILAVYAPGDYEALLLDRDRDEGASVERRLTEVTKAADVAVITAVASFPREGRTAEVLISRVRGEDDRADGLARPTAQGGRAMDAIERLITQIAPTDLSVLILGESGVGKGVIAARIHEQSRRNHGPFVSLNCGGLSETLLESELFGHARGAFTGATSAKKGLIEAGHGGTVFLDEIAETPPALQVRLLRVAEERELRPVGENRVRHVDVRFVAATNADIERDVEAGRFRRDLYYRLNGVTIVVPPLRERTDEIVLLAHAFVEHFAHCQERTVPRLTPAVIAELQRYYWPGNIRELRNMMERAVALCDTDVIEPRHIPTEKTGAPLATRRAPPAAASGASTGSGAPECLPAEDLKAALIGRERQRILEALEACAYNQSKAAKTLGIARNTLSRRMDFHGIPRARKMGSGRNDGD